MAASRRTACLLICLASAGCQAGTDQPMTPDEQTAIAETVGNLYEEIAIATNALELDRLLGFYLESDDLTYVAQGQISRAYATFVDMVYAQFGAITGAELHFSEKYVDVVNREVVVVTAKFDFTATLGEGNTASSAGTFVCIYVFREGRWEIQHSSHTFPVGGN